MIDCVTRFTKTRIVNDLAVAAFEAAAGSGHVVDRNNAAAVIAALGQLLNRGQQLRMGGNIFFRLQHGKLGRGHAVGRVVLLLKDFVGNNAEHGGFGVDLHAFGLEALKRVDVYILDLDGDGVEVPAEGIDGVEVPDIALHEVAAQEHEQRDAGDQHHG